MSERLGMVEYGDHEEHVFLGRDLGRSRNFSEATAQEIDREVKKLCDDAYSRAKHLISSNRDKLEIIAKALLEFETLDGDQVKDIVATGQMRNPPNPPPASPARSTDSKPAPDKAPEQAGLDFPGGLSGAPA
jgi:cell division protease FtsH